MIYIIVCHRVLSLIISIFFPFFQNFSPIPKFYSHACQEGRGDYADVRIHASNHCQRASQSSQHPATPEQITEEGGEEQEPPDPCTVSLLKRIQHGHVFRFSHWSYKQHRTCNIFFSLHPSFLEQHLRRED